MADQQVLAKQYLAQLEVQMACIQTRTMAAVCEKVELNHPEPDL
jgi:hypothetical protein